MALIPRYIGVVVAALWIWLLLATDLNHDVAGILHFADRMLKGEVLYQDMIDINPPLAFLWSLPSAWLAEHTHWSMESCWNLYVSLLGGASLWASYTILRRVYPTRAAWITVLAALVLGPGAAGMLGQREHLMLILCWPWMCSLLDEKRFFYGWALLAMLGMAFKPPFLLMALWGEGYRLHRYGWNRWFLSPLWLMGVMGFVYLVGIWWYFPLYIDRMLPWLLGPYQQMGHVGPWDILTDSRLYVSYMALVAVAFGWRHAPRLSHIMMGMALACLCGAVVQGKGWPYHLWPFCACAGLAFAVFWASRPFRWYSIAALCIAFFCVFPLQERLGWQSPKSSDASLQIAAFLQHQKGEVLVISPMLSPIFPGLLETDLVDKTPAMTAWPVQSGQACPNQPLPLETDKQASLWFRDQVAKALNRRVSWVLVDPVPLRIECPGAATFVEWLQQDPVLAPRWRAYRMVGTIWRLQIWQPL